MDEPFGAVDPIVRAQLQQEFLRLQSELHKTIVFVTHDVDEAILLGDRITVLTAGAHIEQVAAPADLLAWPGNEFVSNFLGRDRGLKLLSLLPVDDVPVDPIHDVDGWRLVTDERERPIGWSDDHGGAPVPVCGVGPDGSARSLLDAAVSSPTGCAVRVDDAGRAVGLVRYESIGHLLARRLAATS
jgi:osmoprotectant transport system ATP-binding protein